MKQILIHAKVLSTLMNRSADQVFLLLSFFKVGFKSMTTAPPLRGVKKKKKRNSLPMSDILTLGQVKHMSIIHTTEFGIK